MKPIRLVGIVVFAVGVVLLGFAFNAADAPVDRVSDALTGRYTDRTMWYFVLGGAAALGGALAALFGSRG